MRLLVDTNVLLLLASGPERIPKRIRDAIDDADERYFSAASAWEIAIKASIGKLSLPVSASEYVRTRMRDLLLEPLDISHAHAAAVEGLPFHHHDPFDRILVAQALLEGLVIATTDRFFARYGVHLAGSRRKP